MTSHCGLASSRSNTSAWASEGTKPAAIERRPERPCPLTMSHRNGRQLTSSAEGGSRMRDLLQRASPHRHAVVNALLAATKPAEIKSRRPHGRFAVRDGRVHAAGHADVWGLVARDLPSRPGWVPASLSLGFSGAHADASATTDVRGCTGPSATTSSGAPLQELRRRRRACGRKQAVLPGEPGGQPSRWSRPRRPYPPPRSGERSSKVPPGPVPCTRLRLLR